MTIKTYRITVDGHLYTVMVEDVTEVSEHAPAPATAQAARAAVSTATTTSAPQALPQAGDVVSSLGGVIDAVLVLVGERVERNQPVVTVEAMKMKNAIVAPHAGTVTAIKVNKGDAVDAGQPLLTLG